MLKETIPGKSLLAIPKARSGAIPKEIPGASLEAILPVKPKGFRPGPRKC
jgi:hypothetical protein